MARAVEIEPGVYAERRSVIEEAATGSQRGGQDVVGLIEG